MTNENGKPTNDAMAEVKAWFDAQEAEMQRRHDKRMRELWRQDIISIVVAVIAAIFLFLGLWIAFAKSGGA